MNKIINAIIKYHNLLKIWYLITFLNIMLPLFSVCFNIDPIVELIFVAFIFCLILIDSCFVYAGKMNINNLIREYSKKILKLQ